MTWWSGLVGWWRRAPPPEAESEAGVGRIALELRHPPVSALQSLRAAAPAFVDRFAVPMIIASAVLGVLVNEITYKNTVDALRVGSSLTDARIAAAGVLQLLTDAETGQRGYLLTGRSEYLKPLDEAKLQVPRMRATVSSFLEASGEDGHADSLRMAKDIQDTLAEIEKTLALARAGDRLGALQVVEAGLGQRRMEDMRGIFGASLMEAASRQVISGVSIDDSLWTNRIAVTTLTLLGAIGLTFYVRHLRLYDQERTERQHELETQVRHRTAELRQLAGYLLTAREDEKAHLARELHDELGALLTAAKFDMARLRRKVNDDPAVLERIEQVTLRLNEGIALKRRIVENLRPSSLATLGLSVSLRNLCVEVAARTGVTILTSFDEVSLTPDGQLAIYRLLQEGLTNVSKYARASEVRVTVLGERTRVRASVEDNGVGFDVSQLKAATHGIAGMRFRIERLDGTMTVASTPGQGTRIEAVLPKAPVA